MRCGRLGDAVGVEQHRLAGGELDVDVGELRVVDEPEQRALDRELAGLTVGADEQRRRVAADREGQLRAAA